MSKVLYLIGSLRNERIPVLANKIRKENPDVEVFDDWFAAGPEADDYWKRYEQERGRSYQEALKGEAARNVFAFDTRHLNRATHALLVLPAGKSGHMEIMYAKYSVGAKAGILLDPTDVRWDVMYQFVDVLDNDEAIGPWLAEPPKFGKYKTVSSRDEIRSGKGSAGTAKHSSDVGYGTSTRLWSE
jgi:hypothetical protein